MGLTPQETLREWILVSLMEVGGSASRAATLKRIEGKFGDLLTEADLESPASRPFEAKWENRASWERNRMVGEALLQSFDEHGSPWALTDIGWEVGQTVKLETGIRGSAKPRRRTQENSTDATLNTRSGAELNLDHPDPSMIKLDDVAGSLSMVPRFGAQTKVFYSVAQHAVLVARTAEKLGRGDLALAALHHDSHEAFICDLPSPVKKFAGSEYRDLADRLDCAIEQAFGIALQAKGTPDGDFIKEIDNGVFLAESEQLLKGQYPKPKVSDAVRGVAREIVGNLAKPWLPEQGEDEFKSEHNRLTDLET